MIEPFPNGTLAVVGGRKVLVIQRVLFNIPAYRVYNEVLKSTWVVDAPFIKKVSENDNEANKRGVARDENTLSFVESLFGA